MSWHSKVTWSEGLFLRPQHLQQNDRYVEHLVAARTALVTPYPWGFDAVAIDTDLAKQATFALRAASGIMPDGTPFDIPHETVAPPIEVPADAAGQLIWLSMPTITAGAREIGERDGNGATRWYVESEAVPDATTPVPVDEDIDVAKPRLSYDLRRTRKEGFVSLPIARVVEVRDKTIVFDERFAPPVLSCAAHPVTAGWLDRAIGWIETKLEELSRYAADPSAGGGLQSADYLALQLLNRSLPPLQHLRASRYTHPERLYAEFLRLVGELATFSTVERRARSYPTYDHDNLQVTFAPVLRDLQEFLSFPLSRRAIRLELIERAPNAFISTIQDRSLFRNATFVLEVSARRPLTEIQTRFPQLFKVGPNTKMNEIVHAHLPGVPLVHLPTPPTQIRILSDHVYFALDRQSPLWPEFSTASAVGMHFSGDWPELALEFWAVLEQRR
jgi:type VI secretion system protein ImpJ